LHKKLPRWFEQARHFVEKSVADEQALCMPLFPPRIREVHEHSPQARIGSEPRQGDTSVFGEDTRAIAQATSP
jgi:hypothetical protein